MPNLLRATKFCVPIDELDAIMPDGWSINTFKTSTTCQLQDSKPVRIALLEGKKVFLIIRGVCAVKAGMEPPSLVKTWCRKWCSVQLF